MDPQVPLVVPEVNPQDILKHKGHYFQPNCSTIQAVVVLKPLHDRYGIKRIVYSTYQAVSGAGMSGYSDLERGIRGYPPENSLILFSKLPAPYRCLLDNGYTKEEMKMIEETKRFWATTHCA